MLESSIDPVDPDKFSLKYSFPQNEVPFHCEMTKKPDGTYSLQEIIAINIRTNLKILQTYFKKVFYIPIQIWYDETIIGI